MEGRFLRIMVDYHYIKRGNKTYGPYYYRSYRVGNKVKKEYLGKGYLLQTKVERKKSPFPFFILILLLTGLFLFLVYQPALTGKASIELSAASFKANEPIAGNLNLQLKQGELMPEKTDLTVEISNQTFTTSKTIELKKLVQESQLIIDRESGDFYIENTAITGQGQGYGLQGSKTISPFVYFKLEINAVEEDGKEITEIVDASAVAGQEYVYELNNLDNKTALTSLNAGVQENSAYYYDEEGKKTSISEQELNVEVSESEIRATTEFSYEIQGFGSDFISENTTTLGLNLSALNLAVASPGTYTFAVAISYEGTQLLQTSNQISIVPSNITANIAPYLKQEIPNITLHANTNTSMILTDYFTDDNADALTFTATSTQNIAITIAGNIAAIKPAENWAGTETAAFTASDLQIENSTTIAITSTNTPPALARNIPALNITRNRNETVNLAYYFEDSDNDKLAYSSTQPENITISIENSIATLNPDFNFVGARNIIFYATDSINTTASNTVQLEVAMYKVNHPPILTATIPNITIYKNGQATINLADYFADEYADTIIYTISEISDIRNLIVSLNHTTGIAILQPEINFTGNRTVKFTASDDISTAESNLAGIFVMENMTNITQPENITNVTVNHAPILLQAMPNISMGKSETLNINLSQYFTDIDNDSLIYTSMQPENIIIIISGSIAALQPEINFTGIRNIIFYATDSINTTASNLVSINVSEIINMTQPIPAQNITNVTVNETVIQHKAVVGQPVRWTKHIELEKPNNITVKLPIEAGNISVKKIRGGREEPAAASMMSITGQAINAIKLKDSDFWQRFLGITGFAIDETEQARTLENQKNKLKEAGYNEFELELTENATEYEIEYETPAPYAEEQNFSSGKKQITISSDVHYTDILAYTELPEIVPLEKQHAIKVYHILNGTKQETEFIAFDDNQNGFIERIEWLVPSLSNQTYETSITIINIQSYPTLHGNWTVYFNTTGNANLTITAVDGTTWNYQSDICGAETCQLRFGNITCGSTLLAPAWQENSADGSNNSVFYANYSCLQEGSGTSTVLRAAKHTLKFEFGEDVAYAYNDVGAWYSENTTFQINLPPTVTYASPTESNNTNFSRTWIAVNVTVSETEQNITFLLYNTTGQVNKTVSTSQLRFVNWTSLPDGTHYYNVSARDSVNNFNATATRTIMLDTTSPVVSYATGTPSDASNRSINSIYVNVTFNETNYESITFYLYNSNGALNSARVHVNATNFTNFTGLSDGTYLFSATVNDTVNNPTALANRTVTLDTTVPVVSYAAGTPADLTNISINSIFVNITYNETNYANITFYLYYSNSSINTTRFHTNATNFTNFTLNDGTYSFSATLTDASNTRTALANRTVTLDTTKPLVDYASPTESNNTNFSRTWIYVNVSVTETNFMNITFKLYNSAHSLLNSTNYTNQTYFINFTGLSDGNYYYNATVADSVNNRNSTATRKITLDTTAPVVNLTYPADSAAIATSTALFTFNITEAFGLLNCSLYHNITSWGVAATNVTPQTGNNSFTIENLADNTIFIWNVRCYDDTQTGAWGESNRTLTINFWYTENASFKIDRVPVINWTTPANANTSLFSSAGFSQNINATDYALKEMNCTIYSDAALTTSVWSVSLNITGYSDYVKASLVNTSSWVAGTYYEKCQVTDIPVPG